MIQVAPAHSALVSAAASLIPPSDMSGTEWAETFRVLSSEDSAAPGPFRTDARPYQRGIMDACTTPRIQAVTVVGSSQWGKTQIMNNIVGQRIHQNPGPMMVVQPTEKAGEKWSKTRFMPMVRDCPELAARVGDGRSSSNTILEKTFPGGLLVVVGANAPAGLASQPIRDLFIDEVDRIPMEESAGEEGDFEDMAEARTADFEGRRLIFKCSTPLIKGRSRIEKSWQESDQRIWHITCPHCGRVQTLDFRQVVWPDGKPDDAVYACASGCELTEPVFHRAVLEGEWIATRPHITDHAGFYVHGLMVRSMATLAKKLGRATRKGPKALQVFINTQLGEWWDPKQGEEIRVDGLLARARQETYSWGEIPSGVALLVASVDVQTSPQRLEFLVVGIGSAGESWRILHEVIPGNLLMDEPWSRAEDLVLRLYQRADGMPMRIKACAVDIGGHFSKQGHAFARRPRLRGLVHPVKGASQPQRLLVRRSKQARLWLVDTVGAKDLIYASIPVEKAGPGYFHLPNDVDQSYIEQLLVERPGLETKRGRKVRTYEKEPGARNEAIDLEVYALAALEIYAPRDLERMVARTQPVEPETASAPEPEPEADVVIRQITRRAHSVARAGQPGRGGGGMTGF